MFRPGFMKFRFGGKKVYVAKISILRGGMRYSRRRFKRAWEAEVYAIRWLGRWEGMDGETPPLTPPRWRMR
jgi:hypothetical protein